MNLTLSSSLSIVVSVMKVFPFAWQNFNISSMVGGASLCSDDLVVCKNTTRTSQIISILYMFAIHKMWLGPGGFTLPVIQNDVQQNISIHVADIK